MSVKKLYGVPKKYISCPGCGRVYGHHGTKVDIISEECSKCAEDYEIVDLIDSYEFIEKYLGYTPIYT